MDIATRTISVGDDVSLVVETAGDGEPLVLLPGLGCSTLCFHLLIPRLVERGFSVIAINPRGIKESTGPLDNLTKHDQATDVTGVMDRLGLASAHVLGWAWGGGDARCLATDAPDKVNTVILLSAAGQGERQPAAIAALSRLAANTYDAPVDRTRDLALAFLASASDQELGKWLDFGLWPQGMAAQQAAGAATPRQDWWAADPKPMLIIQGLEDRFSPPANGYNTRDEFGDRVRVVDLPDAGHGLVVEQPESIAAAIDDWVRG